MSRKRKPEIVVDEKGFRWDLGDFFLDSHGVQAPLRERLEKLREDGFTPEDASEDIRERYRQYLERRKSGGRK